MTDSNLPTLLQMRLLVGFLGESAQPEEVEQDVHTLVQSSVGEDLIGRVLLGKDAALEALNRLASEGERASEGPTAVGNIKDIESPDVLSAIAGAYFAAFSQNAKTYPYLVG